MNSFYPHDYVTVVNGRCNGRSSHQQMHAGRVTVNGTDPEGVQFRRILEIVDGEIMDNRLIVGGKLIHRVAYGKFESILTAKGRAVTRFHKGSGKGRHGKSRHRIELFGHEGWCHSWYKQGRLTRQKTYFDNGALAYDWTGRKVVDVRRPDGHLEYRLHGEIDAAQQWSGLSVFSREMAAWFRQSAPFSVENGKGKVIFAGQHENRQRVGKWILAGKEHFYEHGVAIPKRLFETPPDQLDPLKLLKISNAQLRMAMLAKAKFDGERLAQCGHVVHRQGAMRLIDVPGLDTRILRVQCPSTKSFYYIHVPHDSTDCEQARQWTFHVGAGVRVRGAIRFAVET